MVMGLYAYLPPGDYMLPLFVGWILCELWLNRSKTACLSFRSIVGAAIIVGVNIWGIPQCILGLGNVSAPACLTAWPTLDWRLT
eukprot:Pgem_evm2s16637